MRFDLIPHFSIVLFLPKNAYFLKKKKSSDIKTFTKVYQQYMGFVSQQCMETLAELKLMSFFG